jgi:hypothetical protein
LFANIGQILNSATPSPFSNVDGLDGLRDKIEGYAWGQDLPVGRHRDHQLLTDRANGLHHRVGAVTAHAIAPRDPEFQMTPLP